MLMFCGPSWEIRRAPAGAPGSGAGRRGRLGPLASAGRSRRPGSRAAGTFARSLRPFWRQVVKPRLRERIVGEIRGARRLILFSQLWYKPCWPGGGRAVSNGRASAGPLTAARRPQVGQRRLQHPMPQIFRRSANTLSKVSLAGLLLFVGGLISPGDGLRALVLRDARQRVHRAADPVQPPRTTSATTASTAATATRRSRPRRSPASRRPRPA